MTRSEAIRQVLEDLTVIDGVTNPSAEDSVTVGRRLDQARAFLTTRGLCWWDEDSIPDDVSTAFCAIVAARAAAAFGKTFDASGALGEIASLKSGEERPPVRVQYF